MTENVAPPRPDPWATTAPLEGLRDNGQARIVCLAPSVNLTPMGNTMVPVPYMVSDTADHDSNYASTVFFTGQAAMTLRSFTQHSHGDEAGTGGGVKSGTHGGICEPISHAPAVNVQGSPVIRHGDTFYMNNRNTTGQAYFVRDTSTSPAPSAKDDYPSTLGLLTPTLIGFSGDEAKWASPEAAPAPAPIEAAPLAAPLEAAPLAGGAAAEGVAGAAVAAPVVEGVGGGAATAIVGVEVGTGPPGWLLLGAELLAVAAVGVGVVALTSQSNVRVTNEDERKKKCEVGPYKDMKSICAAQGAQAHHIVPDYTLRYGNRVEGIAGKNRITGFPNFQDGQSICLKGNAKLAPFSEDDEDASYQSDNGHSIAHQGDQVIEEAGAKYRPTGTLTIGLIKRIAIFYTTKAAPECFQEIRDGVAREFPPSDDKRLGRATLARPSPENVDILSASKGATSDNWQTFVKPQP